MSKKEKKKYRIDWRKEVTLFGVTMELKYWVIGFIFLTIGIICFILPFFISSLVVDLASFGIGIVSILLASASFAIGASKRDINAIIQKLDNMNQNINQRLNIITQELHGIREILERIEKRLTRE